MPNQPDTIIHILEQAAEAGAVTAKAMFGGHTLYCDGKIVGLICDDTLFLKPTPGALALVGNPQFGPPYEGAKPHLVADAALDDPEALATLIRAIWHDQPVPKPRKSRKTRSRP